MMRNENIEIFKTISGTFFYAIENPQILLSFDKNRKSCYKATFLWQLNSVSKIEEQNHLKEEKIVEKINFWQQELITILCIPEQNITCEWRLENTQVMHQKIDNKVSVYFVLHVDGDDYEDICRFAENLRKDVATLLSTGKNYYQFMPVIGTDKIFEIVFDSKWLYGKKFQRGGDVLYLESQKSHVGFNDNFEQEIKSQKLEVATAILGNSTGAEKLYSYLHAYTSPISLRIMLKPNRTNDAEKDFLRYFSNALHYGKSILDNHKQLIQCSEEKKRILQNRIEEIISNDHFVVQIMCLSTEPISLITDNIIVKNLFAEKVSNSKIVDMSKEEIAEFDKEFESDETLANSNNVYDVQKLCSLPLATSIEIGIVKKNINSVYIPNNLEDNGLLLGYKKTIHGKESIYFSDNAIKLHAAILGQSGTGKSTLMQSMILQQIHSGEGVCVIDPHGDLYEAILEYIPENRKKDVVLFNPVDEDCYIKFNPLEFDKNNEKQKSLMVDGIMEIFDKLYLNYECLELLNMYIRNLLFLVMESKSTIMDIPNILYDKYFRLAKANLCEDPDVAHFWKKEVDSPHPMRAANLSNIAPYIVSRISPFIHNHFIRPIINAKESSFNIRNIMDNKKIFLVSLSKGMLGNNNSNLLGMFIINRIYLAALSRQNIQPQERTPFTMYIDEVQNFACNNIAHIFAEARKYNLRLICANQNLSQLRPDICNSILGTVGSIFAFRPGIHDLQTMGNFFSPQFQAKDFYELPNYNVITRMIVHQQPSLPFSFETSTQVMESLQKDHEYAKKPNNNHFEPENENSDDQFSEEIKKAKEQEQILFFEKIKESAKKHILNTIVLENEEVAQKPELHEKMQEKKGRSILQSFYPQNYFETQEQRRERVFQEWCEKEIAESLLRNAPKIPIYLNKSKIKMFNFLEWKKNMSSYNRVSSVQKNYSNTRFRNANMRNFKFCKM